MRDILALVKEFIDMPLPPIEVLLERKDHGARVGAVSIMDWQALLRGEEQLFVRCAVTAERLEKELFKATRLGHTVCKLGA
jgi:hypothetical protein